MSRISSWIRALLLTLLAAAAMEFAADVAEARAGGGRRSVGRTSRPAHSEQYRQSPPPSYSNTPSAPQQRGGFGRALAGGIAGGFLGSMLFSSLGHAAPGLGGGGAGGIGLIEILLIGGLAFLAFRWWKSRQQKLAPAGTYRQASGFGSSFPPQSAASQQPLQTLDMTGTGGLDTDEATDIFFKIQGAFTRRELSNVADRLSPEMYRELGRDLEEMKAAKKINRLENISVRRVDILDRWNEAGTEYARVRFTANLLDYVVDEISAQVLEGSAHEPVKFEEDWTFARTTGYAPWQLVGISQV